MLHQPHPPYFNQPTRQSSYSCGNMSLDDDPPGLEASSTSSIEADHMPQKQQLATVRRKGDPEAIKVQVRYHYSTVWDNTYRTVCLLIDVVNSRVLTCTSANPPRSLLHQSALVTFAPSP